MRSLTVVATSRGLALGGLLAPAVAPAECPPPTCDNRVESGTLTLSIQSGQPLLGPDRPTNYDEITPLTASKHWD